MDRENGGRLLLFNVNKKLRAKLCVLFLNKLSRFTSSVYNLQGGLFL